MTPNQAQEIVKGLTDFESRALVIWLSQRYPEQCAAVLERMHNFHDGRDDDHEWMALGREAPAPSPSDQTSAGGIDSPSTTKRGGRPPSPRYAVHPEALS